jgi:hypothetical protein
MIKPKGGRIMKRFLAGILVGGILMASTPVFADTIIGKVVQGTLPLYINGSRVSQDLIVIDGVSYVPLKAAADLFDYDIQWMEKERQVVMNQKSTQKSSPQTKCRVVSPYVIEHDAEEEGVYIDGEAYAPLAHFRLYVTWQRPTVTVRLPNRETINMDVERPYTQGCDGFTSDRTYLRIGALGLDWEYRDGVIVIE